MIKYPISFSCEVQSEPFEATAEGLAPIPCAIPPAFGGPGGGYSPEDLYAIAVTSCFIATFKVFAAKGQFAYSKIEGKATLIIDRNAEGVTELQKLNMDFTLHGVQDEAKAKALLQESEKYCLVSNAIKSEKSFNYSILSE